MLEVASASDVPGRHTPELRLVALDWTAGGQTYLFLRLG